MLAGHEKGILSLSWCQKDADLLLSSGKDGRTIAWNPTSGDIVAEVSMALFLTLKKVQIIDLNEHKSGYTFQ